MGFFDRFKKQTEPSEIAPAQLVFQSEGSYEIASCPGESALSYLGRLREEGRRSGFTVILLGGKDNVASLADPDTSPEEYLKQAAQLDADKWLKKQVEEDPERFSSEMGDWPQTVPKAGSIMAHLDVLSRKPMKVVYIAKIPTSVSWQAPAYIGMGGWNDCPNAAVLTAFAKRWHERFGAEIASITADTMEFSVKNPPAAKEQAIELAKEQFIVCSDIVDQGVETISALAAWLLNSNYWYFWWD